MIEDQTNVLRDLATTANDIREAVYDQAYTFAVEADLDFDRHTSNSRCLQRLARIEGHLENCTSRFRFLLLHPECILYGS